MTRILCHRINYLTAMRSKLTDPFKIRYVDAEIRGLKEELRSIRRRDENHREYNGYSYIIKAYGCDGYVSKIYFPTRISSYESADEYFIFNYFMDSPCSMYDCTGQAFTIDYKITKQAGRFVAYHKVGLDV